VGKHAETKEQSALMNQEDMFSVTLALIVILMVLFGGFDDE